MMHAFKNADELEPGDVVEFSPGDVDILVDSIEYPDGLWLEWADGASGYVQNRNGQYKVIL
jgi:hypothetical protein